MPGIKMELSSCHLDVKEDYLRIESAMMLEFSKEENTGERSHGPWTDLREHLQLGDWR